MIKRNGEKGLTLIEVVLSIAIIGAGLIGVMYVFSGGTRSAIIAERTVVAVDLAREKMEEITAKKGLSGYAAAISTNFSDGQLSGDYADYARTVTITEVDPDTDAGNDDFLDASPGSGYARVIVTVSWNGGSTKLETLLANYTMP